MPTCAELGDQLTAADALIVTRQAELTAAQVVLAYCDAQLAAAALLESQAQSAHNAACTERESVFQDGREHDPPCW